jgi:hypothetical protein
VSTKLDPLAAGVVVKRLTSSAVLKNSTPINISSSPDHIFANTEKHLR